MRGVLALSAIAGVATIPSAATAHGLLGTGHDIGHYLLWVYAIAFAALIGFVVVKLVRKGDSTQVEMKAVKRRITDLESTLASCTKQLKNAEDYPVECGLSDEQRQEKLDSATSLRQLIDEEKLKLIAV
ncbi:MAG: hypothetical protein VCC99_13675 [Alphaproteobacteria bacterium]